jgi:hypothetical protein
MGDTIRLSEEVALQTGPLATIGPGEESHMGTQSIPEDAPRQARYCPSCGHLAVHWGLRTTIEKMVEARDMRPSGGVGRWTCADCGRREDVIEPSRAAPAERSAADLERWEDEGGAPLDADLQ